MSDQLTKQDLLRLEDRIDKKIDKAVTDLSAVMSQFANDVNNRFDGVDARFERIEEHLDRLEESHNRLMNTIDGFIGRIDTYETELAARDAQFARLLEWAKEVSKKTGIPLKGF